LVNSRAIALAGINAKTADPLGGKINHDATGNPTGLLDDSAQDFVTDKIPKPTAADDVKSATAALDAMRKQGITTFLDAMAVPPALAAFASVEHAGGLTARAHFAVLITPPEGPEPKKAVAHVTALAHQYDGGPVDVRPGMTVRNVKLFLDGVISAPALSGAMLEPYFAQGAGGVWAPSTNRGPEVYFPAPVLRALLLEVVAAGFEPHMHADGDRAVHEGLDGIQAIRETYPKKDVRAAIAHDEIVDPADFPRYRQLNAIPVLSFQWEKPASDTVDNARDYLGPARFKYMEPAGVLAAAGARIAYGSDWPVDPLDEWFALKVGVARTNAPSAGAKYAGRLSVDPGLERKTVLRAITMNSSYELHQERLTGSIEVGKLADLIVLDRNVLKCRPRTLPAPRCCRPWSAAGWCTRPTASRRRSIDARAGRRLDRLRQADKHAAPRTVLRCADADAGAVADFVNLVEGVDEVDARRERAGVVEVKHVAGPQVDLGVVGQVAAVRNVRAVGQRLVGAQARSHQKIHAEARVMQEVGCAARGGKPLFVIQVDVVSRQCN
jgi:predicted amidohydrolase YtcJ